MPPSDLDLLLRLRLVVARVGESDNANWWASDGVLSPTGQYAYDRIAPRTGPFARARVAFAVAQERCASQVPPGALTLWTLPADTEEAFDDRWSHWLDHVEDWAPTFAAVEAINTSSILTALVEHGLIDGQHADAARALTAAPPDPSVRLAETAHIDVDAVRQLAAGFACSQPAALVVPYVRSNA
ncbi:BrxE family protein [Rubrivirga litoralis]|uniref:BrxE family protein n=1 Tax=Rubrivirga litoralis TaxID=3075598 RepID=A0ABU3BQ74_9BACT|nr:BrxE family protein [Rubrivirga sp. F394]MDT0631442.1 BrxE family protein [Rubrivirga sp. F394]